MFKLDAPTIAAIGSIITTWLGMILAYLHGGRKLAAAAAAPSSAPAAQPPLEPLPAIPAAGSPAARHYAGYGQAQP